MGASADPGRDNPHEYRTTWTSEEMRQVGDVFPPEEVPEALDLFGIPEVWETYYEVYQENHPKDEADALMVEERDKIRTKRARWQAAAEMGFSPEETALAGARALYEIDRSEGPRRD